MDAKVYSVQKVYIGYTKNVPPSVVIGAVGTVPTSGWSDSRLVPRVYITPPEDGLWDFDFIASAPSGIALQVLSPISSAPFVAEVPEWFKGVRVHASTNSLAEMTGSSVAQIPLTQFAAASLDGGGDFFPWANKADGGVDGFPWSILYSTRGDNEGLPTNETVLEHTIGSLLGMYVRVHKETDPVTEDYRKDRINFVVAEDKPSILRVYIG